MVIHISEIGLGLRMLQRQLYKILFLPSESLQFNEIDLHKTINRNQTVQCHGLNKMGYEGREEIISDGPYNISFNPVESSK